jgi:hypothetical protein
MLNNFLMIFLLSLSSFSFAKDFDYKKHIIYSKKKIHKQRHIGPKDYKESSFSKREGKRIKKGKKVDFIKIRGLVKKYVKIENGEVSNPKKIKKFWRKLLRKFKGPILVEEVDNTNSNIVKLKLYDKKDKYNVIKVNYKLNSIKAATQSVDTYFVDGVSFVDINIETLPVGEFKLFFEFVAEKEVKRKKHKRSKKKNKNKKDKKIKVKKYLGFGEFEKVQNAFSKAVVTHESPDNSYVQIDATESYSESGDIEQYTYNVYKDSVLIDTVVSDNQSIFYTFKDVGMFELEVVVTDTSGNSGTSERYPVSITNSAPTLDYTYTKSELHPGQFDVDFTASKDLDGDAIIWYRVTIFIREPDGSAVERNNYWSQNPKFSVGVTEKRDDYIFRFVVYDNRFQYSSEVIEPISYQGDISPVQLWSYADVLEDNPTAYGIGAEYVDDSPSEDLTYLFRAIHEDGTVVNTSDEAGPYYDIFLTKPGNWTIEYSATDPDGNTSGVSTREIVAQWEASDLKPQINWHYAEKSQDDPRVYYVGSEFSDLLDGQVVSYQYVATHSDGTVIDHDREAGSQHVGFNFTKKGTWTVAVTATDNEGIVSDSFDITIDAQWDFDKPIANITLASATDNPYWTFIEKDNSYPKNANQRFIKATHESGDVLEFQNYGGYFGFELSKRGNWNIEYSFMDWSGFSTVQISNFVVEKLQEPVFSLTKNSETNYSVNILTPLKQLPNISEKFEIILTKGGNTIISKQTENSFYGLNEFNQSGLFTVSISIIDSKGERSSSSSQSVNISIILPDGDIIPEDPGEIGKETLAGIDSDSDGVRDDIEVFIFSRELDANEKVAAFQYINTMQNNILNSIDKVQSVELTKETIKARYCLESKLGKEKMDALLPKLKTKMYNTRERLLAWAQTEINFAGQIITLDTDNDKYHEYCN